MNQSNITELHSIAAILRSHSDILYYRVMLRCVSPIRDIIIDMVDSLDRQAFKLEQFADQLQKETK